MASPGDPFTRSVELDRLVAEDELDDFFVGVMEFCQEFGRFLGKRELGFEAVMLCRGYRALHVEKRRGMAEAYEEKLNKKIWSAMELKEDILDIFTRKQAA